MPVGDEENAVERHSVAAVDPATRLTAATKSHPRCAAVGHRDPRRSRTVPDARGDLTLVSAGELVACCRAL